MNRHELTEDVAIADGEVGLLAFELEVLRDEADRRERKDLGLVADVRIPVHHGRRANAASAAKPNVLAHHGVRTDDRPGPDLRALHDDRGRVDPDAIGHNGEQQIHLGHDLIADKRHTARFRHRRARLQQRHFEPKLIARDDLAAELRAVDAVQIDARHRHRSFAIEHQRRGHLRQRLQHQDARHQRHAGKMPLKKILVDRDVLVRDEPLPRFMLVDGVDQHGRVAITEAIEEYGDVHGHGGTKNIRKG